MQSNQSLLKYALIRTFILAIPLIAFCNVLFERSNLPSIGGNSGISIPDRLVFAALFFLIEIILGIEILILLFKEKYKRAGIGFAIGIVCIGLFYLATYINTIN